VLSEIRSHRPISTVRTGVEDTGKLDAPCAAAADVARRVREDKVCPRELTVEGAAMRVKAEAASISSSRSSTSRRERSSAAAAGESQPRQPEGGRENMGANRDVRQLLIQTDCEAVAKQKFS